MRELLRPGRGDRIDPDAGAAPRFVGVVGPSGVGKTVYLGMLLDLLSRGAGGLHGLARGPFSLALHRNVMLSMERQRFPDKTPSEPDRWQWVSCEVTGQKKERGFDIVAPDLAGEAIMAELERPRSNPTVRALIGRCSGLVVLVDILQVIADGQAQELFAMQLVSYLASLRPAKRRQKIDVPVAVVFTKADLCDEAVGDPEELARANAELKAQVGVVAVPNTAAQGVVDKLVAAGIGAILNFAPTAILVRPGIVVRNVDLTSQMEVLSYLLRAR